MSLRTDPGLHGAEAPSNRTYAELHRAAAVAVAKPSEPFVPFVPAHVTKRAADISAVGDLFNNLTVHAVAPTDAPEHKRKDPDRDVESDDDTPLSQMPKPNPRFQELGSATYHAKIDTVLELVNAKQSVLDLTRKERQGKSATMKEHNSDLVMLNQIKKLLGDEITRTDYAEYESLTKRVMNEIWLRYQAVTIEIKRTEDLLQAVKNANETKKNAKGEANARLEQEASDAGYRGDDGTVDVKAYKLSLKQKAKEEAQETKKATKETTKKELEQLQENAAAAAADAIAKENAAKREERMKTPEGKEQVEKEEEDARKAAEKKERDKKARVENQLRKTPEGLAQLAKRNGYENSQAMLEAEEMAKILAEEAKKKAISERAKERRLNNKALEERAKLVAGATEAGLFLPNGDPNVPAYEQLLRYKAEEARVAAENNAEAAAAKKAAAKKAAAEAKEFFDLYKKSAEKTTPGKKKTGTAEQYDVVINRLKVGAEKERARIDSMSDKERAALKAPSAAEINAILTNSVPDLLKKLTEDKKEQIEIERVNAELEKRKAEKAARAERKKKELETRAEMVDAMRGIYALRWNLASDMLREATEYIEILRKLPNTDAGVYIDEKTLQDAQACLKLPWVAGVQACLEEMRNVACFRNNVIVDLPDALTGKTYQTLVQEFEAELDAPEEPEEPEKPEESGKIPKKYNKAELLAKAKVNKDHEDDEDDEDEDEDEDFKASGDSEDERDASDDSDGDEEDSNSDASDASDASDGDEDGMDVDEEHSESEEGEEGEEGEEAIEEVPRSSKAPIGVAIALVINGTEVFEDTPNESPKSKSDRKGVIEKRAVLRAKNVIKIALDPLSTFFRSIAYVYPPNQALVHATKPVGDPFYMLLEGDKDTHDKQIQDAAAQRFTPGLSADDKYTWYLVPFSSEKTRQLGASTNDRSSFEAFGIWPDVNQWDYQVNKDGSVTVTVFAEPESFAFWHDDGHRETEIPKELRYNPETLVDTVSPMDTTNKAASGTMTRLLRRAAPGRATKKPFGARTVPISAGRKSVVPKNLSQIQADNAGNAKAEIKQLAKEAAADFFGDSAEVAKSKPRMTKEEREEYELQMQEAQAAAQTMELTEQLAAFLKKKITPAKWMAIVLKGVSSENVPRLGLRSVEVEPEIVVTKEQQKFMVVNGLGHLVEIVMTKEQQEFMVVNGLGDLVDQQQEVLIGMNENWSRLPYNERSNIQYAVREGLKESKVAALLGETATPESVAALEKETREMNKEQGLAPDDGLNVTDADVKRMNKAYDAKMTKK